MNALYDPDPTVRAAALAALAEFYADCRLASHSTRAGVARAALPHAMLALGDPDPAVRITGIRAIALLASDARGAILDLAGALADSVASVRVAALRALAEFGMHGALIADLVVERLVEARSRRERAAAAAALNSFGIDWR